MTVPKPAQRHQIGGWIVDEPKLTDEQVAWLNNWMGDDRWSDYTSALAEKAVMDRAVEKYLEITFSKNSSGGMWCRLTTRTGHGITGTGPTRFIALINALMEARER